MKLLGTILFGLLSLPAMAQSTVSGYVSDAESGEKLIGATVYLPKLRRGVATNAYGFYSLSVPPTDTLVLLVSYVGYAAARDTLSVQQNLRRDVALTANTLLDEVEVVATEDEAAHVRPLSVHRIPIQTVHTAPVLGGESDLLKTLQLLPGVKFGNEGSAGLYVRGGSPDQNLILLDGVPVYNVSHLFGFLSVFNSDAIHSMELIKGGIPARYGGRLSSVLNINMKEGNLKQRQGVFAISPIAGRFTYEGPIKKDTSSFIISGRRTWLDAIAAVALLAEDRTLGYNFYDLNAKYNHRLNARNRVYVSFYTGRDRFFDTFSDGTDRSTFNFRWGNLTAVARWNRIISPKLFMNTSLSYSSYNFFQEYRVKQEGTDFFSQTRSRIQDGTLRTDFDYALAPSHALRFGAQITRQRFRPDVVQLVNASADTTFNNQEFIDAVNAEVYVEDDITLSRKVSVNVGLRVSAFWVNDRTYANLQPRLAGQYRLTATQSITASYTNMVQYLHLLTNSSLGLPTDLWVSSTENIAPQRAEQVALGFTQWLRNGAYQVSVESYYKRMRNLIAYREGANYLFQNGENWENKIVSGDGDAYGVELLIDKKRGKLTGWLGYTLSYANRWFDEIDKGRTFPFRYDRRHDVSLMMQYKLPKDRILSFTFVYATGNAITLPTARYQGVRPPSWEYADFDKDAFDDRVLLGDRNNYRMPAYHRLDVSYQRRKETKRLNHRTWIFSLYNAYSRLNPYFLYESNGKLKQYSLFPIIPSVTFRLEF